MSKRITGIHHVTAMASEAQANVDFYAGILGLRMVKKTVNFDAPDVYHLYYGNETGTPGTIMTFFPFPGMPKGRKGIGQLTVTSFSIPENALDYWVKRLDRFDIEHTEPQERFGEEAFIAFEDHDGLGLELVASADDEREGFTYGQIPEEHAVKGFYGVTLAEEGYERTAGLLAGQLDHESISEGGNRFRFSPSGKPGGLVDILCSPDAAWSQGGSGTVHHVAFATADDASQQEVRDRLIGAGLNVTPVLDRQYFHSIYFREPGGVLFEVATSDIGFTLDESKDELGQALKLPPWQEPNRSAIEQGLAPVELNIDPFRD